MKVYLGADHAGFELKNKIAEQLSAGGHVATDLGAKELDPDDDYPKYAFAVAEAVAADPGAKGIMICGSGQGMAMAANRVHGARAAVAWSVETAKETRADNDSNVLSLPARFIDSELALKIVEAWLGTGFSGESRHQRRIDQIEER